MTDETSTTAEPTEDKPTTRTRARTRSNRSTTRPAAGQAAPVDGEEGDGAPPADEAGNRTERAAPRKRARSRSGVAARSAAAAPAAAVEPDEASDLDGAEAAADTAQPEAPESAVLESESAAPEAAEAPADDGSPGEETPPVGAAAPPAADVEGELDVETVAAEEVEGVGATAEPPEADAEVEQAPHGEVEGAEPEVEVAADADADAASEDGTAVIRRRRRRRGGRRRRGRGSGADAPRATAEAAGAEPSASAEPEDGGAPAAADEGGDAPPAPPSARAREEGREDGVAEEDAGEAEGDSEAEGSAGRGTTRLQARNRNRGRSSGRSRGKGGRRPVGGVSEETRRAIVEGPPRRMLVNVGEQRTQVAVLEERTLVEHYVTRREDVSYVGNIYLGRVQNVLPGMEAAFVDIGKGRNGVLYAGEVNYDEADLEGDLPRIEDHLKPGKTVLVQVTKDPMGTKGARLTQHLSIAGRYCVLAPGDGMLGISRKLTDEERDRLRRVLKSIKPEGFGLIVRTAAEGATEEQLAADVSRLTRLWDQVQRKAEEVKPLDAVYEEPPLVMRVIRDVFGPEYTDLVVDSEELAERIRDYLGDVSPEMVDKVQVHTGDERIFDAYEVTNQVRRALEKKVWLRSGGYLIIEKTEAMWVIDVNTGKFVGTDNLEETVLKNNLEAADEIARQLRLRDMGGIIVIDFVDMLVAANRDEVLKRFKRELARDKTKSRVMDISKLGLVQMTRKNVSQGLTETFTTTCEACEGRGAQILDHAFH